MARLPRLEVAGWPHLVVQRVHEGQFLARDDTDRQQDGGAFGAEPWIDLDRGYAAFLVLEATSGQGQALMNEIRPMVDRIMDERASRSPAGS